jgi:phosphate transport system substrate-binding protein
MPFTGWIGRPVLAATVLLLVACGGSGGTANSPPADVGSGNLIGAGATFPEPFYSKAFYVYNQQYSTVTVNYQPVGSGGGIQQFTQGTVDFGASDVPMNQKEIDAAGGADSLVQLPTALADAGMAYNLSGVDKLQLDGPTITNIFLGKVKSWNDDSIKSLNSGVTLPNKTITVVHRSDGSGTTYMFSDYLAKQSDEWKTRVGVGKSLQWPVGVGASGNQAVANAVQQTDGSIGYVELAYILQANMKQAYVKNKAGKFIQASAKGATDAAAKATGITATNFSITDEPGDTSYPISTFSWIIIRKDQKDPTKGKALVNLMKWLVTDGQAQGKDLQYAPLPKEVSDTGLTNLKTITSGGQPILK